MLIHARNLEGLTRTVWTVLDDLSAANVQLSPAKCNLCLREITFRGRTYPGPWPSQINDPWEKLLVDYDNRSASLQQRAENDGEVVYDTVEELKLDEMLSNRVDKRISCWTCGDKWVSLVPRKREYGRCPRCHDARDEPYAKFRRDNPGKVIDSDSSGSAWDTDEDKSSGDDHEESSVQHQVKMVRQKRPLEDD